MSDVNAAYANARCDAMLILLMQEVSQFLMRIFVFQSRQFYPYSLVLGILGPRGSLYKILFKPAVGAVSFYVQ